MPLAILLLKAVAAFLAFFGKLRKASLFLVASLGGDLVQFGFFRLRQGYPRPYLGWSFMLWLPDVGASLLLPAVLVGVVLGRWQGATLWLTAFSIIAIAYPALRGEALLRVYWAYQATLFTMVAIAIAWRRLSREITQEEALLFYFGLTGVGNALLVRYFGQTNWLGIWTVNASAYVATLILAVQALSRLRRMSE